MPTVPPPRLFPRTRSIVTCVRRYELLVGETPFGRGSPKATMALIAETTKDPYFPGYLSTYAIDIIKRLLTRDQAARLVGPPQ
jgi:hypothetical protein